MRLLAITLLLSVFISQVGYGQQSTTSSRQVRSELAAGEAPEEYIVEDGDTLHDICDQLLDNPKYWPKLWSLNPDIQNPHFIAPGTKLKFYPGDYMTPPSLNVVSEDDLIAIDTAPLEMQEEEFQRADISHLLYDKFTTPSIDLVDTKDLPVDRQLADSFNTFGEVHDPNQLQIVMPAFIFTEKPAVLASVISGTMGQVNTNQDDYIAVELSSKAALQLNSTYTIVRPSQDIESLTTKDGKSESTGYRYEFVANMNVSELLNDKDYVKAKVVNSRLGVQPDDLVIPYTSTMKKYYKHAKITLVPDPNAKIVGFDYPNQTFNGFGIGVFLNKPLKVGSYLPVYQRLNSRALFDAVKSDLPDMQDYVGLIQVVHNFDTSSFGVVMSNIMDVRVGDTLGKK